MNRTLRIALLREIPENASLRHQWNELVLQERRPQVFYTYEWALAVQKAYCATLQPLIFLAYDESESLHGIAALAADQTGKRVFFLCAATGDYCDFLGAAEEKSWFVFAVLSELKGLNIGQITLTNLPSDSGTVAALRKLSPQRGYQFFERRAYECAQVSLAPFKTAPKESNSVLPGERKLQRSLKWLRRDTQISFDHVRNWNQVEPLLPDFIQAHVARFLITGRISNLARLERKLFVQELARLLSESGWLVLSRMRTGDTTIAWNYGFDFAGTWFWYQPTLDSEFQKYSPGYCLLAKIVQDGTALPAVNTVDLGLGAEEYKETFANQSRETLYVTLTASLARHVMERCRYHAAEIAKSSPKLENALRVAREHLQRIREEIHHEGIARTSLRLSRRFWEAVYSRTEVLFYEARNIGFHDLLETKLVPLDLASLASAVSQYVDDRLTCSYLLRSAERLRRHAADGFALVASDGSFLHFAWVTDFDGFFSSELNSKVAAPSSDCVTIFDCWTPERFRGRGYYGKTIDRLTHVLQARGRRTWIFVAATNLASIHGMEKAAVQRKYSLVRRRILGWQRIHKQVLESGETLCPEVSAQV